jgi:hypothetical protein
MSLLSFRSGRPWPRWTAGFDLDRRRADADMARSPKFRNPVCGALRRPGPVRRAGVFHHASARCFYRGGPGGGTITVGANIGVPNILSITTWGVATSCGVIEWSQAGWTFTGTGGSGGSSSGTRYSATLNGVINTSGGGATAFPGNVAGSTSSGGQYA